MDIEEQETLAVNKVLTALAAGLSKAETVSSSGTVKVSGYYITDKQIRIDIIETGKAK